MSEHRRKPPQPQSGGRAAARRGTSGSTGRRAAPHHTTPSPSASYGSPEGGQDAEERPYGGRADARRAAQRSGTRRRPADGGGRGAGGGGRRPGGGGGPGRGRGRGGGPEKRRFIDYPRSDTYGWRRWLPSWRLVTGTCLGFLTLMMGAAGLGYALVDVPNANNAAQAESNVFYWADGSQMAATGGTKNRQIVGVDQIPTSMQNAVIAAENATFREDQGVDPMGIGRAMFNMATGGETQGGSTITQQYVKNMYLNQEQTISRKVQELFISIKVDAKKSKDDILAGYLNTAFYGRNAYGIQAAAQAYFGRDSKQLSTEQSVFLAALLKGPNLYNPDGGVGAAATPEANRERVEKRWAWILDRQVDVGLMDAAERAKFTKFPKLKKQTSTLGGQTGYLVDIAKDYVAKKTGKKPEELERGGYHVYTTFDKKKVRQLEKAVNDTRKGFLDEKKREKDRLVQFGAASVDPDNGKIVALYGGPGYDEGHYTNNANTSGVPVGSTWKPFVLASAMEFGTYANGREPLSPMTKYNGNDLIVIKDRNGNPIEDAQGRPFRQKNEGTKPWGQVTLVEAMQESINTPFVQLGIDVGLANTRTTTKKLGILEESFDKGNLGNASFSLGTSTPSAIRMADSYATFANSGKQYEPYSVTKVEYKKNNQTQVLSGFEAPTGRRALSEPVADTVTKVLENVVQNGTAKRIKDIGFPVAGKTGTTDKNKSAWFVGYTRELSTAVTLFRTDPKEGELLSMNGTGGMDSIHGGDIPAQLWEDYMAEALKDAEHKPFPEPSKEVGKVFDPSPSATSSASAPEPTKEETKEPSTPPTTKEEEEEEEEEEKPTPPPSPDPSCDQWDWDCNNSSANSVGGANGANGSSSDGGSTDGSAANSGGTNVGTPNGGTTDGGANGGVSTGPGTTGQTGTTGTTGQTGAGGNNGTNGANGGTTDGGTDGGFLGGSG
ncbi:transglycosylase domain-containing protein [Streptomyces sp. NPDC002490]|uniref:transglycosylase domain-containing protein n=1 Tax=Streptomyces sp. NPDC002490 TaxID=3154416 RepID=UPI0033296D1C